MCNTTDMYSTQCAHSIYIGTLPTRPTAEGNDVHSSSTLPQPPPCCTLPHFLFLFMMLSALHPKPVYPPTKRGLAVEIPLEKQACF